ncbi:predicted protein [Ixodes scapularis]|uniref:Predicted protein n=1 Tax=Ixodes scapularis TaxID=6945 RepID=B7PC48_IXOSC|nr:predicted protein [Ixodes scapularis]|eukprot:XP_002409331.1 predicted protein [Ixodes scapularis]
MSSYMLQRFAGYGMLCRFGGCFFIQNFSKKSLEKATVTWKSPYTVYSILCFCFFFWFEAAFIVQKAYVLTIFSRSFARSLLFILHTVVTYKIFVNFSAMVMGTTKLLDFFRMSGAFEHSTGFRIPEKHRWPMARCCLVVAVLVISYAIGIHFFVGEVTNGLPRQWVIAAKVCGYIAGAGFFLYDSLPFVVLRCCTEVLVEYIHAQSLSFRDCDRSKVARTDQDASREIENIRINLSQIRKLKDTLNDVWKLPLAAMSASILLILCVVLYSVFDNGLYLRDIWIILTYSAYSTLCFLEMTCAQRLKDAVRAVPTTDATEAYVQQLRYLHDVIDPVDMCLTGGGFFCIKKSLLVSASYIFERVILFLTNIRLFTKSLFIVMQFAIVTKIVVNLSSNILGAASMVRFFRECAVFETSTGFSPPKPARRLKFCHCIRLAMLTAFLVCSVLSTTFLIRRLLSPASGVLDVFVKIASVFSNYLFFVYDTHHFLILRPCSEVLILYIKAQADILSSALRVPDCWKRAATVDAVERVRLNNCKIRNLKTNLNGVWKASIVTSSVVILLMVCVAVYSAFDAGVPRSHLVLSMAYGVYSTLDFVDMATLSQTLVNEVHYLHNSLNPSDMALSGGGFFRLDMALLVSITGSIITYTVILVQTSEGAEHSMARNITRYYVRVSNRTNFRTLRLTHSPP